MATTAVAAVVLVGAAVVALLTAGGASGPDRPARSGQADVVAAAPSPATTPPDESRFPSASCRPVPVAGDGRLGLGIARPARFVANPVEGEVFAAAVLCLGRIAGRPPVLRTQLPIDVARRTTPGGDEMAELRAFAAMLGAAPAGTTGIVSVRSHDFTRCGRDGVAAAVERASLAPGEPLRTCEYPSPDLYATLFAELRDALAAGAPGADVRFTAWNEPDHPMFTLLDGLGEAGAARQAGRYWAKAAGLVGADRVLAGEFSDRDLATLLRLRGAFVDGAGGVAPPAWALHPYRDLTAPASEHVTAGFERAVAPAPVWLTEVTPQLSGASGIGGDPAVQRARGVSFRAALARSPVRAALYLLVPPAPPSAAGADAWDSALADRSGRARPFVCGLAGLPAERCPGDAAAYGGG